MKNKIVMVALIGLLMVAGLLLVGCTDCEGDCVIEDNWIGTAKVQYKNCTMLLCDVSNSHTSNPYSSPGRYVRCDCH